MRAIYEVVFDDKENVVDLIINETNAVYKEVMQKFGLTGNCDGRSITEMPGDYLQHFKECEETMKSGQAKTYLHYNPQTEWYMLATIVPIDKTHCFVYDNKVEERTENLARVIKELASSKKELVVNLEKEKELNEMKSRFVTTASHEFRTPLATILSSVSLIEKYSEKEDEGKRKKHIERIQSSVNNLIEILNDFLSLGKLEEGVIRNKPEHLRVDEFVKSILKENRTILKKDQKVNYVHICGNPDVDADQQILKNVILNLFSNAVKYSEEGKNIEITTKVENKFIELKIKDYGIGIPEKDQKFLFTRFFRAKNAINIEGTGLGLNIVKKYVELMKGSISFFSKEEEGAEFIVKIPVKT